MMSNLRSSSQVSVYNYPEHLNPFYEDEQHKRLRFWKIKKNNNGGSRRGSFNLGSLRDLLPLKSFRIKKQSSSLGINITSESPPSLRRDFIDYNKEDEDKYARYDPHFRNTVGADAFQRNVAYRSSLQNMSLENDLSFHRNNRYRSTFQNGTQMKNSEGRYIFSGSITPTPGRYLTRMTPGSSMNSISTNPFDDDDDDGNIESEISIDNNSLQQSSKNVAKRKKKRRAPPPPVQVQDKNDKITINNSIVTEKENDVELRINEHKNGLDELSRLTAEFESFVKNSQHDIQHREPNIIEIIENVEIKRDDVEIKFISNEKISVDVIDKENENNEDLKIKSVENITTLKAQLDEKDEKLVVENTKKQSSEEKVVVSCESIVNEDLRIREVELKIQEENNQKVEILIEKEVFDKNVNGIGDIHSDNFSHEPIQTIEIHELQTEIRSFPQIRQITPTPSREETPDFIPLTVREKFHELRIDENDDSNINKSIVSKYDDEVKMPNNEENLQNHSMQVSVPLADNLPTKIIEKEQVQPLKVTETRTVYRDRTPIPFARTEIEYKLNSQGFIRAEKSIKSADFEKCTIRRRQETDAENGNKEGDAPKIPERRRSVKEIIESINKQQKKLKINQPPSPQLTRKYFYPGEIQKFGYHEKPALPSKENVLLKLHRQIESEKKINDLLYDLQDYNKTDSNFQRTQEFPVTMRDTNNNTSSSTINPIPKPRRNF